MWNKRLALRALSFCLTVGLAASLTSTRKTNPSNQQIKNPATICQSPTTLAMSRVPSTGETTTIRVLALHGSEGNGEEFVTRLDALRRALASKSIDLEITTVDGPFPRGKGTSNYLSLLLFAKWAHCFFEGFCWWNMPTGVRSYNAEEYEGFDTSASKVRSAWESQSFDIVLGHSQGAILIAALIAIGEYPYHPSLGYVLNGAAYPNPYMPQLKALKVRCDEAKPPPRVLCIIGQNDQITSSSIQIELRNHLERADLAVSTIEHPGGHSFPSTQDEAIAAIANWVSQTY